MTTFLGTGAMGSALAGAALDAGHEVFVWNRSPGRTRSLVERGARPVAGIGAVADDPLVVCLADQAAVRETLDRSAGELRGRTLINLTTTTPGQARELAAWAGENRIGCLDGAIMAVPALIGAAGSAVLYSGPGEIFERHRGLLELWGTARYFGADAGLASLYDTAMLSGMYQMFAGFLHGAAMMAGAQVSASDFALSQVPFLAAMTTGLSAYAVTIDGKAYAAEGQQSLRFTEAALALLRRASREAGVSSDPLEPVHRAVLNQIGSGHGEAGAARIFEEFRSGVAPQCEG